MRTTAYKTIALPLAHARGVIMMKLLFKSFINLSYMGVRHNMTRAIGYLI